MHRGGNPDLDDPQWTRRRWNGAQAYSDSKLFDVVLAFAVARLWPGVLSNAMTPGWVPTKMGGPGAPDDMSLAPVTQAWLAVSTDPEAMVSGEYFYHQKPGPTNPAARDVTVQDEAAALLRGPHRHRTPPVSAPAGGHVLVIGVDGVRFDLLGPDSTPSIWAFGQAGFPGAGRHRRGDPDVVRPVLGDDRHRRRGGRARHHRQRPDRPPAGRSSRLPHPGHPGRTVHPARGQRLVAAGASRRRRPPVRRGHPARIRRLDRDQRGGLGRRRRGHHRSSPRRSWPTTVPGRLSSTWAPSTLPGTSPGRARRTARRRGRPTSGWDGC
jgi:hypothetical protein